MSLRTLNLPASTGSFRPGLFGVRFGLMAFDRATRAFPRTCSYSVRYTCRWCIITGYFAGGCPISRSVGTIWTGCGCSCRRRRPCISVLCLLRLRAARALRETLTPGTWRPGLLGRHVGSMDGNMKCELGMLRCVRNQRSRWSRMSGSWQGISCMTAVRSFCRSRSHCRTSSVRL